MSESEALMNIIHREVQRVMHRTTRRTPVKVDAYDKETHAVKLKLLPDSMEGGVPVITGWIPLHTAQTGNGHGFHSPPNINDHGWLEFHEDDREAGNFVGGTFNDQFKPVQTVEAGELLYKHKTGSSIYFDKSGNITLTGQKGNEKQTVVLNKDGSTHVTDKAGQEVTLDGTGTITVKAKAGNSVVLDPSGNVQVKPVGGFVFLGGTGADGAYDFVTTTSGPSSNVKAKL